MTNYRIIIGGDGYEAMADLVRKHRISVTRQSPRSADARTRSNSRSTSTRRREPRTTTHSAAS